VRCVLASSMGATHYDNDISVDIIFMIHTRKVLS